MKRIGLDFDGVIATTPLLRTVVAKELFGVEISQYDFHRKIVVGQGLLTDDQYTQVGREVYSGKYPVEPVPGALHYIPLLRQEGHSLQIVTNRSDAWKSLEPARKWLKEYSLDLPITGIVYGNSKAPACAGIDVFVDDDQEKLQQLVGVVPHLLYYRWPYNEREAVSPGIVEVGSWRKIYDHIRQAGL